MKRIINQSFRYVPAVSTNVGATIRREQRRLAKLQQLQAKFPPGTGVVSIKKQK